MVSQTTIAFDNVDDMHVRQYARQYPMMQNSHHAELGVQPSLARSLALEISIVEPSRAKLLGAAIRGCPSPSCIIYSCRTSFLCTSTKTYHNTSDPPPTSHPSFRELEDEPMFRMIITEIHNLLPRHPLQTPPRLVLVTIHVFFLQHPLLFVTGTV